MSTIPASTLASVTPSVLSAGGNALDLIGMMLTTSNRIPIGTVADFSSSLAGSSFFSSTAPETAEMAVYFLGFDNSSVKPGSLKAAQYPAAGAPAYLWGGNASGLTVPQLAALSGSLSVVMDGVAHAAASINLTGASSFTAAAGLVQTGLNASIPQGVAFSAAGIAPASALTITASISGNVMDVTSTSGAIQPGTAITGTGVTAGTIVVNQLSGAAGGTGQYAVNKNQVVPSTAGLAGAYGVLTVTTISSGTVSTGQVVTGGTTTANTQVMAQLTGATPGGTGTYVVTNSQTSTPTSASSAPVAVTYDSVSGGFVITGGSIGAAYATSSAAFATGTLAASLFLTSATGAVVSQGSAAPTPASFMNSLIANDSDWCTFWTLFDPDGSSAGGNAQKKLFSDWVNTTNDGYVYACWDTDASPTTSTNATASLGGQLQASQASGTVLCWQPDPEGVADAVTGIQYYEGAFFAGLVASIDFTATNGSATPFGKSQTGLTASVTNDLVRRNLDANGYNYIGAYATRSEQFVLWNKGVISGPFQWAQPYVQQIWLNNAIQQALMVLFTNTLSLPFETDGYSLVSNALADPINAALNFGAIRAGVPLSAAQATEVNNSAGLKIDTTITAQGYYLQVVIASPQTRQARGPVLVNLFYTDGGSIQQISVNSIDIL